MHFPAHALGPGLIGVVIGAVSAVVVAALATFFNTRQQRKRAAMEQAARRVLAYSNDEREEG